MTQQYDKPRSALFVNRNKTEEKHPDYKGDIELTREVVEDMLAQLNSGARFAKAEISGWKRQGQNAGTYLSLSIKKLFKKDGAQRPPQNPAVAENRAQTVPPQPTPPSNTGDEIPF